MTEHPLDGLDGGTAGHRERGRGVAEVVRSDVRQSGRADGGVENGPAPVPEPEGAASGGDDQQLVGLLALAAARQRLGERSGQRDGALLMGLRGAELESTGDLGGGLGDGQASAKKVDAADPQSDHLPEPETGVGEQADDVAVVAGRIR
nr:hypothetical protein [Geodermatophilus chilensis]